MGTFWPGAHLFRAPESSRPVVLNLRVVTPLGITYQLSCISDTYITIRNSSKVTDRKQQQLYGQGSPQHQGVSASERLRTTALDLQGQLKREKKQLRTNGWEGRERIESMIVSGKAVQGRCSGYIQRSAGHLVVTANRHMRNEQCGVQESCEIMKRERRLSSAITLSELWGEFTFSEYWGHFPWKKSCRDAVSLLPSLSSSSFKSHTASLSSSSSTFC